MASSPDPQALLGWQGRGLWPGEILGRRGGHGVSDVSDAVILLAGDAESGLGLALAAAAAVVPTREMSRKRKNVAAEDAGDQPVYLVVEHKVKEPSHSIVITGTTTPQVMIPLRHAKRGMSFAVVDSRWIVGVGGHYRCHFTIYDLTTSTESGGPWLYTNKVNPVLIPHRDMLDLHPLQPPQDRRRCRFPALVRGDRLQGRPSCFPSRKLPPPPIFPYCINPLEYLHPPDVRYTAHAVVGSHILLSVSYTAASYSLRLRKQLQMLQIPPEPEEKGTCAFDVDTREWEMVDSKNLPFVGEARPLGVGGHLFAAARSSDGATAVYHIEILTCDSTKKTHLSILELPMEGRRIIQGQLFSFSGAGRLCTFDVRFKDPVNGGALRKAFVVHSTYDVKVVDANGETIDALASLVVKRRRRSYKLVGRSHLLAYPAPVVSALTL
nr:uncharacterized protein LOC127337972 [Lolium perenne]